MSIPTGPSGSPADKNVSEQQKNAPKVQKGELRGRRDSH